MKSLGEIYWDIDHECLHSDKTISFSDETTMLFHAAEEYVEELRKHGDRWKSIALHDIDYLKASSYIRREQKGYSEGAEIFLGFIYEELERYGFKIDNGDILSVKETNQPETIPETGENKDANDEGGDHDNDYPDFNYELKKLFKTEDNFKSFYDKSKDLSPENIASLYCDQTNVLNPRKRGVGKTLYETFVNPNQDANKIGYEQFLRYLRKSETE